MFRRALAFTLIIGLLLPSPVAIVEAAQNPDPFFSFDRAGTVSSIQVDTNDFTGAYQHSYDLTLPPGRGGIEPALSLTYSSQDTSNISPFGFGWSISIPYIERINRTGLDKIFDEPYFTSSLHGELNAISTSSADHTYGARVETGDFWDYGFIGEDYWVATTTKGWIYTFATSSDAQIATSSTEIFRWMLTKVEDPNGNFMTYAYHKDDGQLYPETITYTGHDSTPGIYTVTFARESRNDVMSSSQFGFPVISNERIDEIQVKVNGSWVRKYELAYTTGDNTTRSLLSSITETGRDEDLNTIALPATTFTYSTKSVGWTEDTSWNLPVELTETYDSDDHADRGVRFGSFTGDAFPDIIESIDGSTATLYTNNGDGTWGTSTPSNVLSFVQSDRDALNAIVADIDGDLVSDLIGGTSNDNVVRTFNGTNFSTDSDWDPPIDFTELSGGASFDQAGRVADLNGDGLADLAHNYDTAATQQAETNGIYFNDGAGWTGTSTHSWALPNNQFFARNYLGQSGDDRGVRFGEFNGDGLTDVIVANQLSGTTRLIFFNNGDGTYSEVDTNTIPLLDNAASVVIADLNGDGLDDLATITDLGNTAHINEGDGVFSDVNAWDDSFPTRGVHNGAVLSRFVDIDADGLLDVIKKDEDESDNGVFLANGEKPDMLTQVSTDAGATITIAYTPASASENPDLPFNVTVVDTVTNNDGFGTIGTQYFEYEGGEYYYQDEFDRTFAGFATTTVTDELGHVTKKYYHQGNGSQTALGEHSDHRSKIGFPYRTEVYDGSSNLYQATIDKWENASLSGDRDFVKRTRSLTLTYDGDADHRDSATEWIFNDSNGNVSLETQYGEVTGSGNGTFTDSGTDKRSTLYTYATNTSAYIIGLPATETLRDNTETTVSQNRFYYDSQSLGSVTTGNLTKEERLVEGSTYVDTEYTYNTYGLVTQEKDERDKATTHTYDDDNLFVATSTNPESHVDAYLYDYSSGEITKHTDKNGNVFEFTYDALDRPLTEKIPDHLGTPTNLVTKTAWVYTDTKGARSTRRTDHLSAATSTDTYTYFDGLERPIQKRREAEGTYIVTDTQYNARGDVAIETLPYESTGTARTSIITNNDFHTAYTYDPLKRTTAITTETGTQSHAYDQWEEVITDRNGNTKDLTYDALGNLVQVEERNGVSTYTTSYEWDDLGNLTKITDALSNVRNFTYDNLSRLTLSEDLHDSADTGFASTTYTYDNAGNVTSKQDGKLQTVGFTYDDINRVLTENHTGEAGTELTYTYDTCDEGEGRLCSVSSIGATTTYDYDELGNVIDETRSIDGSTFTTTWTYDRQGNELTVTDPTGGITHYLRNAAGLLESITYKQPGTSTQPIITDLNHAPTLQTEFLQYGNGVETTKDFDQHELYRLKSIDTDSVSYSGNPAIAALQWLVLGDIAHASELEGWNFNITPEGSDQFRTEIHDKWVNYKTKNGWSPIDTSFRTSTSTDEHFIMDTAPFTFSAPKRSTGTAIMHNNNRWNIFENAHIDEKPFEMRITAQGVKDVEGVIETGDLITPSGVQPNTSYVMYSGAYDDADLIYYVDHAEAPRLEKLIRFNTKPKKTNYEFLIEYSDNPTIAELNKPTKKVRTHGKVELQRDLKEWKETADLTIENDKKGLHVRKSGSDVRGIGFKAFQIWDSNLSFLADPETERTIEPLKVTIKRTGANTYSLTKHIPNEFFKDAVFPVYADTTSTFYPDPDAETTSVDGYAGDDGNSLSWANLIAEAGMQAFDSRTFADVSWEVKGNGSDFLRLTRGIFLFDTSAIPDTDDIDSATLSLYGQSKTDDNTDAPSLNIYTSNPSSNTSLTGTDFATVGSTALSTAISYSSFSTSGYNDFALNSTGLSNISKTGVSKFSALMSNDASGTAPSASGSAGQGARFRVSTADYTGTSQDPKLVVVHSAGQVAPSAPESLQVEGSTNPTNLTDETPEFTAVYDDGDLLDIATDYQIQVSTSSSDFSSPVWDSTKSSMASTTEGDRISEVAYAGSSLETDTTYYWRIKFWDDEDNEGAWSTTTSSFSLQGPGSSESNSHSIDLDGTGDYLSITDAAQSGLDLSGDFTIEMQLKPSRQPSTGEHFMLATKFSGSAGTRSYRFTYRNNSGTNQFQLILSSDGTAETEKTLAHTLSTSSWNDVELTYDASAGEATISVDGSEIGTLTGFPSSIYDSTTAFQIGAQAGSHEFDGLIDEVRIWDDIRTDTELDDTDDDHLVGNEANLVGYWRLNNNPNDTSSNGNDLTENGNPTYDTDVPFAGSGGGTITGGFQRMSYAYDAVGNITSITDHSETGAGHATLYTYDDLNRLTAASTTAASSSAYSRTFSYDALGNITNKSDQGAYTYGETGYANPHAATQIASTSLTYDDNGNVTNYGAWDYDWDYRNRLIQAADGSSTSTYAYDHANLRAMRTVDGTTTLYPNARYNASGSTTTVHVLLPDGTAVAVIEGNGTATTTNYIHTDHLGGTNVVTDENGVAIEVTSYYPFGEQRIATGSFDEQRKFTGHEYDATSDLTYAKQRYYEQDVARWLSVDPVVSNLPFDQRSQQVLIDPQLANAYGYTRNNPLVFTDPQGEFLQRAAGQIIMRTLAGGAIGGIAQLSGDVRNYTNTGEWSPSSLADYSKSIGKGAASLGAGKYFGLKHGAQMQGDVAVTTFLGLNILDNYTSGQTAFQAVGNATVETILDIISGKIFKSITPTPTSQSEEFMSDLGQTGVNFNIRSIDDQIDGDIPAE